MDKYRELLNRLLALRGKDITITQGTVTAVSGITCCVQVGEMVISDVRLRASESPNEESQMLVTPKIGSAVTIGCLSGDLAQTVVLAVDEVESITINGGKLGGLINIDALTQCLNNVITAFNSHTHTGVHGPTSAPVSQIESLNKDDYEDKTVTH